MSELTEIRAWVDRAEEDYAVAVSALRRKRPLTVTSCFHAQQCAEKYMKAILLARNQPFPKTHDLHLLSTLCSQANVLVEVDIVRLDALSFYAVHARYPGAEPTEDQAREGLATARAVRRFARARLGLGTPR